MIVPFHHPLWPVASVTAVAPAALWFTSVNFAPWADVGREGFFSATTSLKIWRQSLRGLAPRPDFVPLLPLEPGPSPNFRALISSCGFSLFATQIMPRLRSSGFAKFTKRWIHLRMRSLRSPNCPKTSALIKPMPGPIDSLDSLDSIDGCRSRALPNAPELRARGLLNCGV